MYLYRALLRLRETLYILFILSSIAYPLTVSHQATAQLCGVSKNNIHRLFNLKRNVPALWPLHVYGRFFFSLRLLEVQWFEPGWGGGGKISRWAAN